ncbi:MAG: 30S ribosome-binding factor RbfA [Candidatus Glassbacteria bacterium]|nr:30S ribosome-binding factor RbfA [Candidatus Glassbacteria bacterium]
MRRYSYKRSDRLGSQLHREVSNVIHYDINDPRLQFVTVTEVRLSDDLKDATVFISVMGDDKDEIFASLVHAGGFIRRRTGERCYLKYVPLLNFKLDTSRERAERIDSLLNKIRSEHNPDSPGGE